MDVQAGFTVKPLSPVLGAEIIGLDLRQDQPRQVIDHILELWRRHIMLVFRDQDLGEAEQLCFAARFGELGERKLGPEAIRARSQGVLQEHPAVLLVSNKMVDGKPAGAFGDGEFWFHIDSGYAEKPYKYTFLFGLELPSTGGNTRFANMYDAYDALTRETKDKLAGRKALHIHEYKRSAKVDADVWGDLGDAMHFFHPIFVTHPETGRKSLFVDRLMTARIEGLERHDSDATLAELFDHSEKPAFVYEHVWKLGDLVMWDNRCATHGRTWFPEDQTRLLRRCTVHADGVPVE